MVLSREVEMANTAYTARNDIELRKMAGVSDGLLAVGRVAIAIIFVMSGIEKFMGIASTAQMIASKGLPSPTALAWATAALELIGGVLIVIGWQTRIAALALALFSAVAAYFFHDFWHQTGPEQMNNMIHFMKNVSIIGGLLMLAAAGAGRFSVDGPCVVHHKAS